VRSDEFVCHSVGVQPHVKNYCMDLHDILPTVARSQGDFIFEVPVIRNYLHSQLGVTVTQQGHFGIKSTAVQKW